MPNKKKGDYEGKQSHIPNLNTPDIEVFKNVYQGKEFSILLKNKEFTAICPKTGLPDFGTIYIEYQPDEYCLELKSLKEYFLFFRNIGIFHENLVNKVLEDLIRICNPNYLKVKVSYKIRGGIKSIVEREFKKD